MQARGVSVQLLPAPVAASDQASWCDPGLLRELNFSDRLPESGCNAILAHHIGLSQWLGIKASPSWVLPNGDLVRGYQSPEQLLKILDHINALQIRRRPRVDDSHLPATLHPLLRQIFASRG